MTHRKGSNYKELTVLYYSGGGSRLPGSFGDESTPVDERCAPTTIQAQGPALRSKGTWEIKLKNF